MKRKIHFFSISIRCSKKKKKTVLQQLYPFIHSPAIYYKFQPRLVGCGFNDCRFHFFLCFSPSDVNECEETNGGCEALCCNTIGSFYCRCPSGLKLNEDGKTCQGKSSDIFISLSKWVLCDYININMLIWYHRLEFCLSYVQCKCCLIQPLSSSCENVKCFQRWLVKYLTNYYYY